MINAVTIFFSMVLLVVAGFAPEPTPANQYRVPVCHVCKGTGVPGCPCNADG